MIEKITSHAQKEGILTNDALHFIIELVREFRSRHIDLLAERKNDKIRGIMENYPNFLQRPRNSARAIGKLQKFQKRFWIEELRLPALLIEKWLLMRLIRAPMFLWQILKILFRQLGKTSLMAK